MTLAVRDIRMLAGLFISLSVMLGGCMWPPAGLGGFAEHRVIEDFRLQAFDRRIGSAKQRGAETYAALDLYEAELLLNRIKRELTGGLIEDAHQNMGRLSVRLQTIERLLATRPRSSSVRTGGTA
jgi:hypothetical protein